MFDGSVIQFGVNPQIVQLWTESPTDAISRETRIREIEWNRKIILLSPSKIILKIVKKASRHEWLRVTWYPDMNEYVTRDTRTWQRDASWDILRWRRSGQVWRKQTREFVGKDRLSSYPGSFYGPSRRFGVATCTEGLQSMLNHSEL